jgi:hypothetical protein
MKVVVAWPKNLVVIGGGCFLMDDVSHLPVGEAMHDAPKKTHQREKK